MMGLESRIREQIGYHVQGDLGRAIPMAEKADMCCGQGRGSEKGQIKAKVGSSRESVYGQI